MPCGGTSICCAPGCQINEVTCETSGTGGKLNQEACQCSQCSSGSGAKNPASGKAPVGKMARGGSLGLGGFQAMIGGLMDRLSQSQSQSLAQHPPANDLRKKVDAGAQIMQEGSDTDDDDWSKTSHSADLKQSAAPSWITRAQGNPVPAVSTQHKASTSHDAANHASQSSAQIQTAATAAVVGSEDSDCPRGTDDALCSGNGHCFDGHCLCTVGYHGSACDSTPDSEVWSGALWVSGGLVVPFLLLMGYNLYKSYKEKKAQGFATSMIFNATETGKLGEGGYQHLASINDDIEYNTDAAYSSLGAGDDTIGVHNDVAMQPMEHAPAGLEV